MALKPSSFMRRTTFTRSSVSADGPCMVQSNRRRWHEDPTPTATCMLIQSADQVSWHHIGNGGRLLAWLSTAYRPSGFVAPLLNPNLRMREKGVLGWQAGRQNMPCRRIIGSDNHRPEYTCMSQQHTS